MEVQGPGADDDPVEIQPEIVDVDVVAPKVDGAVQLGTNIQIMASGYITGKNLKIQKIIFFSKKVILPKKMKNSFFCYS